VVNVDKGFGSISFSALDSEADHDRAKRWEKFPFQGQQPIE